MFNTGITWPKNITHNRNIQKRAESMNISCSEITYNLKTGTFHVVRSITIWKQGTFHVVRSLTIWKQWKFHKLHYMFLFFSKMLFQLFHFRVVFTFIFTIVNMTYNKFISIFPVQLDMFYYCFVILPCYQFIYTKVYSFTCVVSHMTVYMYISPKGIKI